MTLSGDLADRVESDVDRLSLEQAESASKPSVARRVGTRAVAVAKPLVVIVLAAVVWQIVVDAHWVPKFELAAPTTIGRFIGDHPGMLLSNLATTMTEVGIGLGIAVGFGIFVAVAMSQYRILEESVLPIFIGSQVIPTIAIAPLLVLFLGFGVWPKVATAALISFFPILINMVQGLKALDSDMQDLGRVLCASRLQTLKMFTVPNALPYLFAGIRISVTLSIVGAVVGEFVTADHGLGYLVLQGESQLDPALLFAALVVLAAAGLALFALVRLLEAVMIPWARRGRA